MPLRLIILALVLALPASAAATARQKAVLITGASTGIGRVLTERLAADGYTSAYVMSKHAIEGFTDSLASEMAPHGVHVSAIEPGTYRTEIFRNAAQRLGGSFTARASDLDKLQPPDDVAAAFAAALSDRKPKRRYMVVPNEDQARRTLQNRSHSSSS